MSHHSKKRRRADDDEHSPPSATPTGDQPKLSRRQLNVQRRKQKLSQKNNKGATVDINESGVQRPSQSERQHKRARLDETGLAAESTPHAVASSRIPSPNQKSSKSRDDDKRKIDTRALYEAHKEEIDQWYDEYISRKSGIPQYSKVVHSKDRWFNKVDAWMKDKGIAQTPKKNDNTPHQTKTAREISPDDRRPHHTMYPEDKVRVPEYPFDKLSDFTSRPDGRFPCSHPFETNQKCCKDGLTVAGKKSGIKKDIKAWRCRIETLIDKKELNERHKTWEGWVNEKLIKKYQPERWKEMQQKKREKSKAKWEKQRKKRGQAETSEGASDESDDEESPQTKRQKTTQPSLADQPANIKKDPPRQHRDLPQPMSSNARTIWQISENRSQRRHKNRKGGNSRALHEPSKTVQQSGNVIIEPVAARPATTQPQTQAPMPMTQVQTVQSPVGQGSGSTPQEIAVRGTVQTHPPVVGQFLQASVPQAQSMPSTGPTYQLPAGMWDFDKIDSELERFFYMWSLVNPANRTHVTLPPDSPSGEGSVTMSTHPNFLDQTNALLPPHSSFKSTVVYPTPTDTALSPDSPTDERSLTMSAWLNYADQMAGQPPNSPADEQLLCQTIADCRMDWQRYCNFYGRT